MVFENRQEAGKKLGVQLLKFRNQSPFVLALPRGGVPIGFEIAEILHAPLEVLVIRKIGISGNAEFGIGAVAEGGIKVFDQRTIQLMGVDAKEIETTVKLEEVELQRRVKTYRENRALPDLTGKTAILVDDGMATGMSARAAILSVQKLNPKKIVLATPVCLLDVAEGLKNLVDELVCLAKPFEFMAVGIWYKDYHQISDQEVVALLQKARKHV